MVRELWCTSVCMFLSNTIKMAVYGYVPITQRFSWIILIPLDYSWLFLFSLMVPYGRRYNLLHLGNILLELARFYSYDVKNRTQCGQMTEYNQVLYHKYLSCYCCDLLIVFFSQLGRGRKFYFQYCGLTIASGKKDCYFFS